MKTYWSLVAVLAVSVGIASSALARGGGGGGRFAGGGAHFGGGHFGGGGAHFSMPAGREHFGHDVRGRRDHFWGGGSPYYYDGGWGYDGSEDYSTPSVGDSDSEVVAVQQALTREGYYSGPIDGVFGAMTQNAITGYERNHRLPVTGTIDQALLSSLDLE